MMKDRKISSLVNSAAMGYLIIKVISPENINMQETSYRQTAFIYLDIMY